MGDFEDTLRGLGAWTERDRTANADGSPRGEESSFSTLFSPIYPYNKWPILVPFISVAGALAVLVLTGVAAASLVALSFALIAVVFLLSEVFGYEVAMPPGMAPR